MKQYLFSLITIFIANLFSPFSCLAQLHKLQTDKLEYKKSEFNLGLRYNSLNERDSWLTNNAAFYEEMGANNVTFFAEKRLWDYNENRQHELLIHADACPLWGLGNSYKITSTSKTEEEFNRTGGRAAFLS